jgi:exopolysaccharide production protein ExoZ
MARVSFIPSLESLRGLAALTVCLFHAGGIHYAGRPLVWENSPADMVLNGFGAVVVFFVLSGFVLRRSLDRRIAEESPSLSRNFVAARVFRLLPVVIVSVLLVATIQWYHGTPLPGSTILKNAALIETSMLGQFWTLQVELLGSLLILAAFLLERRLADRAVLAITLLLVPLAFAGRDWHLFGVISPSYFHCFLLGYLLATMRPLPQRLAIPAILAGLLLYFLANALGSPLKGWLLLMSGLAACLLIAGLATGSGQGGFLHWWPIRRLGTISYSFYAVHSIPMEPAMRLAAHLEPMKLSNASAAAIIFSFVTAATVLIAIPMYLLIEKPGMALGRRLLGRNTPDRMESTRTPARTGFRSVTLPAACSEKTGG